MITLTSLGSASKHRSFNSPDVIAVESCHDDLRLGHMYVHACLYIHVHARVDMYMHVSTCKCMSHTPDTLSRPTVPERCS